ncbi:MAG: hypothetical protein ABI564_06420 [Ideonella sp.]
MSAALATALLLAAPAASAADAAPTFTIPAVAQGSLPLTWRVGAERLRLPGNESMGLVGASALLGIGNGWHVGPVVFGAATGQRGGLFVIGGEALWRTNGPWGSRLEAGLAVGGGGGAALPVGSGLMLRPHLDWSWPVGPGWLGISASRVSFPDGRIGSNQVGLVFAVDDQFRSQSAGSLASGNGTARNGFGFDRLWLNVGQYRATTGAHYGYGGLRADHWLSPGTYFALEAAAAAQGGSDGYAELLVGLGKEWPLWRSADGSGSSAPHLGVRAAVGMAGGGAVDTGGGALLKLAATARWDLPNDLVLGLEAGRTIAPDGRFRANHLQVSLGFTLDRPVASNPGNAGLPLRRDDFEWGAVFGHFPKMDFRDGSTDAVQTIGIRMRRPLSAALDEHLQLTGGIQFAAGGKAGAYGAGLIGLAWATPLQQPGLQWGVELLAGAAGGGGVDSRGGAVVQPMVRVGWADGAQRWQLGIGQIESLKGRLSSPVVELSYSVAIGVARR